MKNLEILAFKAAKMYLGSHSINKHDCLEVEQQLKVRLTSTFKETYKIFSYDLFRSFDFLSFPRGVIEETKRLRKDCELPRHTLFLAENDASILLMRCFESHEEVYWMDVEDFYNYCEGKPLEYSPTIFKSFPEFFEYLLNEEEKSRSIPA